MTAQRKLTADDLWTFKEMGNIAEPMVCVLGKSPGVVPQIRGDSP
jgi:hypothetical protein